MSLFIKKLLIYSLPVMLFLLIPSIIMKGTGEYFADIDSILESDRRYLIGFAYNESNYKYIKWRNLITQKTKKVVALGSSRVLQFRQEMFNTSFYNAGFTVSSLYDFIPFLKSLPPEKYPEILLVGLDQWQFIGDSHTQSKYKDISYWKESLNYLPKGKTLYKIYRDLIKGKYTPFIIFKSFDKNTETYRFGLNAVVNNKGLRNDGSFSYGNTIDTVINRDPSHNDFEFRKTLERLKIGKGKFSHSDAINTERIIELERILNYCSDHQIKVIAFLPPFADKVNEFISDSGNFQYMSRIYSDIKSSFDEYDSEIWDLSHLSLYDSNDNEVIDGFHGGETTYLKMLVYMIANGSVIKDYSDSGKLIKDLSKKANNYIVYSN